MRCLYAFQCARTLLVEVSLTGGAGYWPSHGIMQANANSFDALLFDNVEAGKAILKAGLRLVSQYVVDSGHDNDDFIASVSSPAD